MQFHPDLNKGEHFTAKMAQITGAYEVNTLSSNSTAFALSRSLAFVFRPFVGQEMSRTG